MSAVIRSLVEHHLLLSETAMRRDLSDPRTAENVAALVGDPLRLELLRALTEADSLATGPSAWSSWKATLIDELTAGGRGDLRRAAEADARGCTRRPVPRSDRGGPRQRPTQHAPRVGR